MPATAPHEASGLATFETLHDATRRYRLTNSNITNVQIARHLGLEIGNGDFNGSPCCIFFRRATLMEVYPVAIRTKADELAIFHLYQRYQGKMVGIGERILD
ncbi:hypothetical protein HY417_03025 [Candidatus Kaiserbacteria bacterium]|nr:hypothetical protein [Candidatus Kaiserbacteria bacterium]